MDIKPKVLHQILVYVCKADFTDGHTSVFPFNFRLHDPHREYFVTWFEPNIASLIL